MDNNSETLDILSIISFIISILNYQENLKQTSNNELLKELQKQDEIMTNEIIDRLQTIEKQNKKILNILEGGKNEN